MLLSTRILPCANVVFCNDGCASVNSAKNPGYGKPEC